MEEARTQIRGTAARVTVVEQNVANGTANISNETKRRLNITTYKGFSDVPVFSGTHDEYEDWSFKLRTFLSTEEKWFGILLKTVESLDREVKDYDIDDFVQNSPPEVTTELADWMNTQLYNVLTLKTKDNPLQTVKNVADEEDVRGIAAWVKLLRSYKGKNANRSQQLAERVHNIKRVISYGDVLPRMEKWEASLKEHEKDTQKEVADVTKANCLRNMVPNELHSDLTKMSHLVQYDDVKWYIIEQVSLRQSTEKKTVKASGYSTSGQTVPVPMDTSHVSKFCCDDVPSQSAEEHVGEDELLAVKGKGKGFRGQCFHCHQYGHRLSECPQKDKEMGKAGGGDRQSWQKGKGGNKGQYGPWVNYGGGKSVKGKGKGSWIWPGKGQWGGSWQSEGQWGKGLHWMDDNQQSLQSYEDNVLFCLNRAEVSDRDTSAFLDNLGWTIQRAQDKIQLQGTGERKPGKWCSKNSYEVLSDQVDDDEVSTTDGEMCSDLPDEEVWPRLDSQRSARVKCTTSMKRVHHRKAWKTVGFNDEIQYLGDGGQQPEINNLSGSGWIKVSAIMDSGAAESVAPPSVCHHLPMQESAGSKRGQEYHTANGAKLVNQGQRRIKAVTEEGVDVQMTYQVANVTKPLNSVSKICDQGNIVVFSKNGGCIVNRTGNSIFSRKRCVHAAHMGTFTWI